MVDFLRKYQLEIVPTDGKTKIITGLQIEFTVDKGTDSELNKLDISIYNLSPDTKGMLKESKDTVIRLKSAYRNGTWSNLGDDAPLELIFEGTIFNVRTTRKKADVITQISSKDGNVPLREARASSQWPEGVTLRQIVLDLVETYFVGISVGEVLGDALDKKFQNGYSARGPVRKIMDNLTSTNQLQWNITDGIFNIYPKRTTLTETKLIVTNVLGTPEDIYQDPNKLRNTTEIPDPDGVKFRVLLNPKFKPGKRIEIDSTNISGEYKTEKVTHKGSYRGNVWETMIQAVKVD